MANIDKELRVIKDGQYGVDIRMDIHDALMKIAAETPDYDPDKTGPFYMISCNNEFAVTSIPEDYIVAVGQNFYYVIDDDDAIMCSSTTNDYCIVKE